jgi:psp operon transcriptional activator
VTRIGSSRPLQVDVRIVAATNEHLPRLVEESRFRADLLDRLSFEVVTLPPLRNRQSDIPVLADHFGRRMALEIDMAWPGFSTGAMEQIQSYEWPGNVRELRNVVERAVYRWSGQEGPIQDIQFDPFESPWRPLAGQGVLSPSRPAPSNDFVDANVTVERLEAPASPAPASHDPAGCADFRLAIAEYEKAILATALERCRWNQRAAAAALSLTYDQLRHAMRRHELQG